jgi:hypothetical protein
MLASVAVTSGVSRSADVMTTGGLATIRLFASPAPSSIWSPLSTRIASQYFPLRFVGRMRVAFLVAMVLTARVSVAEKVCKGTDVTADSSVDSNNVSCQGGTASETPELVTTQVTVTGCPATRLVGARREIAATSAGSGLTVNRAGSLLVDPATLLTQTRYSPASIA